MHFWVSATRGGFQDAFCCPRKIGTNWFIPAFVNSRFGESGSSDADGTIVCCFSRKKSKNDCRISAEVMIGGTVAAVYDRRKRIEQTDSAVMDRRYRSGLLFLFVELRLNRCLDLFVKRRIVFQRV